MRKFFLVSMIVGAAAACGKKSTSKDTDTPAPVEEASASPTPTATPAPEQAKDVAAVYSTVNTQIGALHLTDTASLALTETSWTAADWSTDVKVGTKTVSAFVDNATNPDGDGAVYDVVRKLDVFCYIGAMIPPADIENNLPKVAAAHTVTIDDDMATRLKTNCGVGDSDVTDLKSTPLVMTVEAVEGGVYDRHVVLTIGEGDDVEENPYYIKNSDGVIAVGMYEGSTKDGNGAHGLSRTLIKMNLVSKDFQFEYFARALTEAGAVSSMTLSRGYHNDTTKEIAFASIQDAGKTYLALSGNEKEEQVGAYVSMTASDVSAFVCFAASNSAFINNTGCSENADNNRKYTFSASSDLPTAIAASSQAAWELTATTAVANFDNKTIFSLSPTLK